MTLRTRAWMLTAIAAFGGLGTLTLAAPDASAWGPGFVARRMARAAERTERDRMRMERDVQLERERQAAAEAKEKKSD